MYVYFLVMNMELGWVEVGIYCALQQAAGIIIGICYSLVLNDLFDLAPAMGLRIV